MRALNHEGMFNDEASSSSSKADFLGAGQEEEVGQDNMRSDVLRVLKHVNEAWHDPGMIRTQEHVDDNTKVYKCVAPRLNCTQCGIDVLVFSFDDTYKNWHVKNNMWFEKAFINQFGQLLQHLSHAAASAYDLPQFCALSFPVQDSTWGELTQNIVVQPLIGADAIVCVAGDGSHYVVIEVEFSTQIITVYDGFASRTQAGKWVRYAQFVLQSVGKLPKTTGESYTCVILASTMLL